MKFQTFAMTLTLNTAIQSFQKTSDLHYNDILSH